MLYLPKLCYLCFFKYFPKNYGSFSSKTVDKNKLSKYVSGYFKTKKKVFCTLSQGAGAKDLRGLSTKKKCGLPYNVLRVRLKILGQKGLIICSPISSIL